MERADLDLLLKAVDMSRVRFLYGLECVPGERLDWRPTEHAPTALELAAKAAGFGEVLAQFLATRRPPERAPDREPPATREAATERVDTAYRRLQETVTRLQTADLAATLTAPWGETITVEEMLWWIPYVLGYLQGQLNEFQICYGDTNPNIPPRWGQAAG